MAARYAGMEFTKAMPIKDYTIQTVPGFSWDQTTMTFRAPVALLQRIVADVQNEQRAERRILQGVADQYGVSLDEIVIEDVDGDTSPQEQE